MNIALVLAGGKGLRAGGDTPKQYESFKGKMLLMHCLLAFEKHSMVDSIIIAADAEWRKLIDGAIKENNISKMRGYSEPGETRQLSIYNGLKAASFAKEDDIIIIHDAARPFLKQELITRCITAMEGNEAVMPVLSIVDTLYIKDANGAVIACPDRQSIVRGQTPECFCFGKYFKAHQGMSAPEICEISGSTQLALLAGMKIATVEGDAENIKVTSQKDLQDLIKR